MADTIENRFPDCLYLDLEGTPLDPESEKPIWKKLLPNPSSEAGIKQIDLSLTINFNEQWQELLIGRVKFGLRGGELRCAIDNGRIPYTSRELAGSLAAQIEKGREEKASPKSQSGIQASGSIELPMRSSKTSAEASFAQEQTTGTTDKFQVAACQITQEAQALIDRITGAETQDFSELARIAGLDPRKDFVGADLSGIDLSGLDLSDADLSGANLSHTNLSSANLSHANLSGTNLSNANLTAADLSGADLSCANLSGANLSQTKLKDACLNQSTGLSEESKSFLQNGGASIETSDKPTKTPGERYPRGKYIAAR